VSKMDLKEIQAIFRAAEKPGGKKKRKTKAKGKGKGKPRRKAAKAKKAKTRRRSSSWAINGVQVTELLRRKPQVGDEQDVLGTPRRETGVPTPGEAFRTAPLEE